MAEENGGSAVVRTPSGRGARMTVKLLAKWKEGMEVSVWEGKEGVWGGYGGECEEGYEGECGKEGMEVSVWEGKEGVWGGYGGE